METAALVVSIFALLASVVSAGYAGAAARTAKRGVKLGSEAQPVLQLGSEGKGPRISIHNAGTTVALTLGIEDLNGNAHSLGTLGPGQTVVTSIVADATRKYRVTWMTIDQEHRHRRMRLLP